MSNLLYFLYRFFEKRFRLFVGLLAAVFLFFLFFSTRVSYEENIFSFFPKRADLQKLSTFVKNGAIFDKIIVKVSINKDNSTDQLVSIAEDFVADLNTDCRPRYIKDLKSSITVEDMAVVYNVFYENLPLFMEDDDYKDLESRLNYSDVEKAVGQGYRMLLTPGSMIFKSYIMKDPLGISFSVMKKMQKLQMNDNFQLYNNYIVTKDGKNLLFFITPVFSSSMTFENSAFFKLVDRDISKLYSKYPGLVTVDYFGVPVVSVINANQIKKDIFLTVGVATVLILFILLYVIRDKKMLSVYLLPMVFGVGFSLTAIYFIKGKLSLISLGAGSALLGIIIDYSIYVSTHFRIKGSVRSKFEAITLPILIGSITSAAAFLCIFVMDSEILSDLALFTIFSLIGTAVFALLIIPHFYNKTGIYNNSYKSNKFLKIIFEKNPGKNKIIIIAIVCLTIICFYFKNTVRFQEDLYQINFQPDELKKTEKAFENIESVSTKSIMLITEGAGINDALSNNRKLYAALSFLQNQQIIDKITSVSSIIPSVAEQQEKIEKWNTFWSNGRKERVLSNIKSAGKKYSFKNNAFSDFEHMLNKKYSVISEKDIIALGEILFPGFVTISKESNHFVTVIQMDNNKYDEFYRYYEKNKNEFGGTLVNDKMYLTSQFIKTIRTQFDDISIWSMILIFSLLVIYFGRLELALISYIPIMVSWTIVLGIMGAFGIQFNIFNIIVISIVFGLGVDYTILMLQGHINKYKTSENKINLFRESLFFSFVTTAIGLAVLFLAQHPALKSIALISTIGVFSVYIMAVILIPFMFEGIIPNKARIRPLNLKKILFSSMAYLSFFVICLFMLLPGFVLYFIPFGKKRISLFYNFLIMICSKFILQFNYIFPGYKKVHYINKSGESFKKSSVIIANHQSMLDIPALLALNSKMIILTSDRVWNSPVFGKIVKAAGYYPVSSVIDSYMDELREKIVNGYSIIIFPERVCSENGDIKEFHKEAFYLADVFNLDIVPVVLFGTGDQIRKGTFVINEGISYVTIFNRVPCGSMQFGGDLSEKAENYRKYFMAELDASTRQYGDTTYFRKHLIDMFIYKGPAIEWYLRVKLYIEKNYKFFNDIIPRECSVIDLGCGYGHLSLMLGLTSSGRIITGVDYDSRKIDVAANISLPGRSINFLRHDVLKYNMPESDVFIISDMLHYISEEEQVTLIEKCMGKLNLDGIIIIRDANKDFQKRHFFTRLSEIISTRINFNRSDSKTMHFVSKDMILQLAWKNKFEVKIHDMSAVTSNLIFVLSKK